MILFPLLTMKLKVQKKFLIDSEEKLAILNVIFSAFIKHILNHSAIFQKKKQKKLLLKKKKNLKFSQ